MQLIRLEKEHLSYANELRNKYIKFIRQPYPHNLKQQEDWFNSTKDLYWIIEDEFALELMDNYKVEKKGIIGLTNIDLINKKAELSLITKDYLIKEYADFALEEIEKYCFRKLSLNKIFITAFDFDDKKNEYFSKRYKKEYILKENVFYDGKFFDEYGYVLYANDWRVNLSF